MGCASSQPGAVDAPAGLAPAPAPAPAARRLSATSALVGGIGGGSGGGGSSVGVGGVGVGVDGGGAVAEPARAASTVRAWAFGHTHYCTDFVPAGFTTRLVANQRGYRDSVGSSFYRPDFVLEVP